ncbi:zinc-binding metallopeptidase family protein [Acidaminobacter hydrogenoformans]|uniref:IAA-amino acid hydrolase n=1 Tax=Acidaminobacter hydrogenoformans DSM 2784 TaxID=1120920 RepID=A0A1G5S6X1_9FIRM|nr:hypothetical protein [Acidaminobacter hydrogenoformans]SCZ82053.1 IAA-amino acid hydrolase [Acidaminobacter hydrogenoformans DSM 2784]
MGKFDQDIEALFETLVAIRRRLHQQPELGFDLPATIETITAVLQQHQIPYEIVAGSGILAQIGRTEGPAIMLRADLDALPIEEATNLPYKSAIENKMHGRLATS